MSLKTTVDGNIFVLKLEATLYYTESKAYVCMYKRALENSERRSFNEL